MTKDFAAALAGAWQSIVGQADAVSALQRWSTDPVHAYMFVGPAGTGKRQAARVFAGAIQGQFYVGDDGERQRQLHLASEENHADVEVHEPTGPSIPVDYVREAVIPSVFRKPVEGPRRIVVIDRFHTSSDRTAGALLKTVEEPAPNAIIILLTETIPHDHVAIASRCARIDFPPIGADALASWLEGRGVVGGAAQEMIEASGGDLRRLELLVSDDGFAARTALWNGLPTTLDGTGATAGSLVRQLGSLIDAASEPLKQRHLTELEELDAREEMFGTRGSGRSGIDARHKRELRKLRTDEVQFGLRMLAKRYGRELAAGGGSAMIEAVDRVRNANAALVRNPNESLLLHNLFWNLPTLD